MADVTARAGLPFPEPADPNNVPADLEALAVRVAELLGAPALTTLQRDALAGADLYDGRIVYNTTAGRLEIRRASSWEAAGPYVTSSDITAIVVVEESNWPPPDDPGVLYIKVDD